MKTDSAKAKMMPRRRFVRDVTLGVLGIGFVAGVARNG